MVNKISSAIYNILNRFGTTDSVIVYKLLAWTEPTAPFKERLYFF